MGRDIKLPKRIKGGKLELTEMQKVFLDCYLLQVGTPKLLFRMLLAPADSEKAAMSMMQSLLKNSDAVSYMESRKRQLEEYYFGEGETAVDEDPQRSEEDIRKIIYNKISNDLVQSIQDGNIDYKQGAIIEKFMNKVLDYDDREENAPEPPRVYLPENCRNCRYRIAIEEGDNVIDECKCCNYRKNCLERGIEFDYKTQLNLEENGIEQSNADR